MNKVTIEISKDSYDFLRELCEKMNLSENDIKFPYHTVSTTKKVAVPPYEGDEQEYNYKGTPVKSKDVISFCKNNNIALSEFLLKAQHTCDYKGSEEFEGFFLTEDACEKYIDENIDSLKAPYPYRKSLGNNSEMLKVVNTLFEITGVKPEKQWVEKTEVEVIEDNIKAIAQEEGYKLSDNVSKIAKAKLMMKGLDNWHLCPCYPADDIEHGCGTELCKQEIERDGVCHCHLYNKK